MPFPTFSRLPDARPPRKAGAGSRPPGRLGARRWRHRALRIALRALLIGMALPVLLIIVYRFVPPPVSALMMIRSIEGAPLHRDWVPLDRMSPSMVRAVVASEDEKFCVHHGFDWDAIGTNFRDWRAGRTPKGASTISMQTAKNLFLWPDRSVLRKAIEAYLTVWIELFWDKHRIIETYLNIVEWGDGIYGADTAARHYFGKPASALSPREAALLAAVLPDPLHWSPVRPSAYVAMRAVSIREHMPEMAVPGTAGCH
jgi:monofunctional biosynthetic peptidoglycan transglycosylase